MNEFDEQIEIIFNLKFCKQDTSNNLSKSKSKVGS